ncbi:MAG: class I SAM-dependent methyltransferase [Phototrophicaceae bacterium]
MAKSITEIIQDYRNQGDHTGWFEVVYANAQANDTAPPWASLSANREFVAWAEKTTLNGTGRNAIVVGCGLGDDAQYLATLGFQVTAFDVSPTAIEICQKRFPDTDVTYQQADLFALPDDWQASFDFVFENRTIQALPTTLEQQSKTAIANLVAENGQLVILCHGRESHEPKRGIPWALSRQDLAFFTSEMHMTEQVFEEYTDDNFHRFLVLYQK